MHTVSRKIGEKDLIIETGRVAKQAHGSILVRYGDTQVLVTAVQSDPRPGLNFFPLICEYREMMYAAGRFPGGFFKREGRPSQKETLTSRLIDRPVRPRFPKGFNDEIQVIATVLSADKENNPDVIAVSAASAALCISQIPFLGPLGTVRVGMIEGEFVINPTTTQLKESTLNLIVSAAKEGVVMVEGGGQEIEEETLLAAIRFGFENAQQVIELQEELIAAVNPTKIEVPEEDDGGLFEELRGKYLSEMEKASFTPNKKERGDALTALCEKIVEEKVTEDGPTEDDIKKAFDQMEEEAVRKGILAGKRPDGRKSTDIRALSGEVGVLARTHGSGLFTRGETQALVVATLGTTIDEQKIDGLEEAYYKRFILHYNFPPYSVGEVKMMRGPSRRDIGHGALAERCLSIVMPDKEKFPYTVRLVSEILESNGSSSMASVCGGTLALMDAGVPISRPVAGIAMGLVIEGDQTIVLTDIAGAEDHFGDMDLKIAGTQKGITGLQMDIKISSVKVDLFEKAFAQARDARLEILRAMLAALSEPRKGVSENAPKLVSIKINPELIGSIIGPGGKIIRALQEETETKVEVSDDGSVLISGDSQEGVDKARSKIEALTLEVKVGEVFDGKVVSIREGLGAFVEIAPGKDALLHVSEIANEFVKNVSDKVSEGDVFPVKVIKVENGKVRVSKKALEKK